MASYIPIPAVTDPPGELMNSLMSCKQIHRSANHAVKHYIWQGNEQQQVYLGGVCGVKQKQLADDCICIEVIDLRGG